MTSPRIHPATSGARKRAFTLVEMLVVLGIAAVVIPILLVSTSLLSQGFGEKQALNQINAALALARATAIRDGRDAALLFTADAEGNTLLHIATLARDQGNPLFPRFVRADDRAPDRLGTGIRVVAPNGNNEYVGPYPGFNVNFGPGLTGNGPAAVTHFAVRFAPDGTIRRVDGLGNPARFWFDNHRPEFGIDDALVSINNVNVDADPTFHPVDILALYDKAQAESAAVAGNKSLLATWINDPAANEGRAVVILFNRYTGLALRAVN